MRHLQTLRLNQEFYMSPIFVHLNFPSTNSILPSQLERSSDVSRHLKNYLCLMLIVEHNKSVCPAHL